MMRRKIYIIIFNILLFFVFAELLANIFYFAQTGQIFYTSWVRIQALEEIKEPQEEDAPRLQFHPFFGFTERSGFIHPVFTKVPNLSNPGFAANNYGFHSQVDYPFVKSHDDQYIIGVFGGSVSIRFVIQAQDRLIKSLKQSERFEDKDIVVLSFGNGGYKQPQQLQILSFFLSIEQEFDWVINIDGFNEVALSNINNQSSLSLYMPSAAHFLPLKSLVDQSALSAEKLNSLSKIMTYNEELGELETRIVNARFASVKFLLEQYYQIKRSQYEQELLEFEQLDLESSDDSLIHINHIKEPLNEELLFERIAQNWAQSSILMKNILAWQGLSYLHILQPNQYYSKKNFSELELVQAIHEDSPYRPGVQKGYPVLEEKIIMLEQHGVNFHNGVNIFDNEAETVYLDNCCHYNQFGNNILADFIAKAIIDSVTSQDE